MVSPPRDQHRVKNCDGVMDVSIGSDDVFESDCVELQSSDIPERVVTRYRQAVEDEASDHFHPKTISKWTRVKKAFLPLSPPSTTGIEVQPQEEGANKAQGE